MTDPRWPSPGELVIQQLQELKENDKDLHQEIEGLRLDLALLKERGRGNYKLYAFLGGLLPALGVAIYHIFGS